MSWKLRLQPDGPNTFSTRGKVYRQGVTYNVDQLIADEARKTPRIQVWEDDTSEPLLEPVSEEEQPIEEVAIEPFVANPEPVMRLIEEPSRSQVRPGRRNVNQEP